MVILAYQHGVYPRSESLVAATRDLDRGRTTEEAVAARFDEDLQEFVEVQKTAGLAFYSDGLLRWPDLFRPLVRACRGLQIGALTRWFDNNTFFRAPEARGDITFDGALPLEFGAAPAVPSPRVATLPSPYLLSRVAVFEGSRNQLMVELSRNLIRPLAERLVQEGYGLIQMQEPWIAFHGIDVHDWRALEESVGAVTEGLAATTVFHTYFGNGAPFAERLRELPVDAIGFDCIETDVDDLGSNWDRGILLGCIDGRRSLVEPVGSLTALVERVAERLQPGRLFLSSASDLELLPRELARRKVLLLGEAAACLRERLS